MSVLALVWSMTSLANPAAAEHVGCGDVISQDTTLDSDIGPCPGHGIIIGASNVVLDLNGHTITGDPEVRQSPDKAGVLLRQVSAVTVRNGTVESFDAGVAIMGGGGNTVRNVTAQDNVNYRVVTGRDLPEDTDPATGPFCDFGDGITAFNSSGNVIEHNRVVGNGPYSGISLVYDSNENVVSKNKVLDNDLINRTPAGEETSCGLVNLGGAPGGTSRESQDAGVRIEGPGADRNVVEGNQIRRSGLAGVFVNGFHVELSNNNGDNLIRRNTISDTGLRTHEIDERASGIQMHDASPSNVWASYNNTIEGNNSSRNYGSGVEASGNSGTNGNTFRNNVVNHNGLDGVHIARGSTHNTLHGNRGHKNGSRAHLVESQYSTWDGVDGADYNPGCASNDWSRNRFRTVNQPCVAANGTGWMGGPGRSGDARGGDSEGPLGRGRPVESNP